MFESGHNSTIADTYQSVLFATSLALPCRSSSELKALGKETLRWMPEIMQVKQPLNHKLMVNYGTFWACIVPFFATVCEVWLFSRTGGATLFWVLPTAAPTDRSLSKVATGDKQRRPATLAITCNV